MVKRFGSNIEELNNELAPMDALFKQFYGKIPGGSTEGLLHNTVTVDGDIYPSPIVLLATNPMFAGFVTSKLQYAKSIDANILHTVYLIRKYSGAHGWLDYAKEHEPVKVVIKGKSVLDYDE